MWPEGQGEVPLPADPPTWLPIRIASKKVCWLEAPAGKTSEGLGVLPAP